MVIFKRRDMHCSKLLTIFSAVVVFFIFLELSSSAKMEDSSQSSSSDVCDKSVPVDMISTQSRQRRTATKRVIGCNDDRGSPSITINCPQGSTINITRGACLQVSSCDAYKPSLESGCVIDKTSQWAAYCKAYNPCTLTPSCKGGTTCQGGAETKTYGYADYTCVSEPSGQSISTASPHDPTTASRGWTTPTPSPTQDFTTDHGSQRQPPTDMIRKSSLFRQIKERRLQNHVIHTKRGLSLVECGAACNQRDDCVSFNIGKDVCELNDRMMFGVDVLGDEFVKDERYKYYEKQ